MCLNANLMNRRGKITHTSNSAKPEKRRHPRLSLHLPLEYSSPESSRLRLAYMGNICEGGLLMYTPKKMDIGQNLRVKFYYNSPSGMDYIQAFGEVMRVEKLGAAGKDYRCGVRFSNMPPDYLKRFRKFLKSLY
jgi:Tfp pilus assembly protein PilZ